MNAAHRRQARSPIGKPIGLAVLCCVSTACSDETASPPPTAATAAPLAGFRVHHAMLRVADFDDTVRWYTDNLGFRATTNWEQPGGIRAAYLERDAFRVEVISGGTPTGSGPPPATVDDHLTRTGYRHLCFEVSDVDASFAALRRRGVRFLAEPYTFAPIERRLAHFVDNNGNVLELSGPVLPGRREPVRGL